MSRSTNKRTNPGERLFMGLSGILGRGLATAGIGASDSGVERHQVGLASPDYSTWHSQAARGETPPKRYVGRAGGGSASTAGRAGDAPVGGGTRLNTGRGSTLQAAAARSAEAVSRAQSVPWSVRMVVAVVIICLMAFGLRLPGITTAPIDPPTGAEATHAAFAELLAGKVGGGLDPVRYFPPPAPWHGQAPANPVSGLPVYGWLNAALTGLTGESAQAGRALSMLFSVCAGLLLFALVRRAAGARAGLYALLFYSISPLSVVLGQQVSPASLSLAAQALAVFALCRWKMQTSSTLLFGMALGAGVVAALIDPGSIFLAVPAAYLALAPTRTDKEDTGPLPLLGRREQTPRGWREAWEASPHRGKLAAYTVALVGSAALWKIVTAGLDGTLVLAPADGGGGVGAAFTALLQGSTYVQIVGTGMEKLLTILGALLLIGGLLRGARRPFVLLFHAWLAGGLLHVLADASRLGRHDDVLLPLVLPACALVGIGAAWAGSLPARVWLAVTEQRRESDADFTVSPHTAWLLDIPEEHADPLKVLRPQAQLALGKSVAQRTQAEGFRARRTWVMGLGNLGVLGILGFMLLTSWSNVQARLQPSVAAIELKQMGQEVRSVTAEGARMIVAGPAAAEVFYASGRTGWALSTENFSIAETQRLQREGAAYLLSTDQEWLGHHPDYVGLLTSYSVVKLGHGYILFDLNTKPAANDRSYFLESGHTLGGEFKRFWEQNGGVAKLGYPISEETEEANPLDGQVRRVQYFERAVLEYHPEYAGRPDAVMLASVGRWVTAGRQFPTVAPFTSTPDRAYFEQTGHSVKQAFLQFWQREGGVLKFGYPISEELPEISSADGKVYTVQYFERARFEWHPTDADTPTEVQLGLIGKQAWEAHR